MDIRLHSHAAQRIKQRGATETEVSATVKTGERFEAKFGRTGFRRNFPFDSLWREKRYSNKQIEAYAVEEDGEWLVLTVIVKYF